MAASNIKGSAEFADSAKNLVAYANPREGDQVLIIMDDLTYNEALAHTLRIACEEAGVGEVFILKTKRPVLQWDEPGKPFIEAMKAADIVFNFSGYRLFSQPWGLLAMQEYGTKIVRMDTRHAWMLNTEFAKFPKELLYLITRKTVDIVARGKRLRVTSKLGMDLTVGINPFAISGGHSPVAMPGERVNFPGGMVGINPQDPANGVLVMNFIYPSWNPPQVILDEPIRITIEDHWATKIEGGCADWVEQFLEEKGDANARNLAEVMWGNHPKAYPYGWQQVPPLDWFLIFHYRYQLLHCALGRGIADFPPFSKIHLDFYMINPTVYIDNEVLIDNGHHQVLEDPEVIRCAEKYGDPKELLTLPPLPKGFLPAYLKGEAEEEEESK